MVPGPSLRGAGGRCSCVRGLYNRISHYLVRYSWCAGLNWTGLSWAGAGQRGALCARVRECVCECGGMYNRIRYYLVRCSWRWAFASCSARLRASACHWLPSFWTISRCWRQPTSSEFSLSTSCPAETEEQMTAEEGKKNPSELVLRSQTQIKNNLCFHM